MRTRIQRVTYTKVKYSQESNQHIATHGPVLSVDHKESIEPVVRGVMNINQLCNISSWISIDDQGKLTFMLNPMEIYEHIKAHVKHKKEYAQHTGTPFQEVDEDYILARLEFSVKVWLKRNPNTVKDDVAKVKRYAEHMRFTYKSLTREDAAERAAAAEVRQNKRIGWPEIQAKLQKETSNIKGDTEVILKVAV